MMMEPRLNRLGHTSCLMKSNYQIWMYTWIWKDGDGKYNKIISVTYEGKVNLQPVRAIILELLLSFLNTWFWAPPAELEATGLAPGMHSSERGLLTSVTQGLSCLLSSVGSYVNGKPCPVGLASSVGGGNREELVEKQTPYLNYAGFSESHHFTKDNCISDLVYLLKLI